MESARRMFDKILYEVDSNDMQIKATGKQNDEREVEEKRHTCYKGS
jgi:hypothetical protein